MANAKSASGGRSIILRDMCRLHGCFSLASRHGPSFTYCVRNGIFLRSFYRLLTRAKNARARPTFHPLPAVDKPSKFECGASVPYRVEGRQSVGRCPHCFAHGPASIRADAMQSAGREKPNYLPNTSYYLCSNYVPRRRRQFFARSCRAVRAQGETPEKFHTSRAAAPRTKKTANSPARLCTANLANEFTLNLLPRFRFASAFNRSKHFPTMNWTEPESEQANFNGRSIEAAAPMKTGGRTAVPIYAFTAMARRDF
jgi:hypothetical protein